MNELQCASAMEPERETSSLPCLASPTPPTLLTLPKEIRLLIYDYASDYGLGTDLVKSSGGRLIYRLAWPLSPLDERSEKQVASDRLGLICSQTRSELLPSIMRGFVVKFPARDDNQKEQCMKWVGDISECFARSMDWIWLEGMWWTISLRFVRKGACRERTKCEDGRVRDLNTDAWYYPGGGDELRSKTFDEEEHFVIRVDYRHFEEDALILAKKMVTLVQQRMLVNSRGIGSLGKSDLVELLEQTPLAQHEMVEMVGARRH